MIVQPCNINLSLAGKSRDVVNRNVRELLTEIYEDPVAIQSLKISCPAASGQAIFGEWERPPRCIVRLRQDLRVLNLSATQASQTSLEYLGQYPNLERVYFDHCPNMLAQQVIPHAKLRVVSFEGTHLTSKCFHELTNQDLFPSMETIIYTQGKYSYCAKKIHGVWKDTCISEEKPPSPYLILQNQITDQETFMRH
jgi:hypothetical protein